MRPLTQRSKVDQADTINRIITGARNRHLALFYLALGTDLTYEECLEKLDRDPMRLRPRRDA